jgi:hypothetical protein
MFDMDLIDFDVEKNITRLQKIKWHLNSRWPPKIEQLCSTFQATKKFEVGDENLTLAKIVNSQLIV